MLLILLNFIFLVFSFGQENYVNYYFAINFEPSYNDVITFCILKVDTNGKIIGSSVLTRNSWMRQIVGLQNSIANPKGINLLKEAGIKDPDVINNLWKLRYSEHPFDKRETEKGWAANLRAPSKEQMKMLESFGLKSFSDYVYGDNLIKLLLALEDPTWINEYSSKK